MSGKIYAGIVLGLVAIVLFVLLAEIGSGDALKYSIADIARAPQTRWWTIGSAAGLAVILTFLICWRAPSSRAAWGRLLVVDGFASCALAVVGILLSSIIGSAVIRHTAFEHGLLEKVDAIASDIGFVVISEIAGFTGFVVGIIFLLISYVVLHRNR